MIGAFFMKCIFPMSFAYVTAHRRHDAHIKMNIGSRQLYLTRILNLFSSASPDVGRALRVLLCPVVGRSRPAVIACCTVRSGVFHHWIHHLWPQGAVTPGFNPLRRGWVYRPAKRGMPTGSEAFLELPIALGFGPATGPTLKTALCHIRTLVGRRINTALRLT